ncbi:molybdopterin synthase sulfur carrier subunit [Selaginella moellendorffii]|nr:molybdopterin synthase sulfur carrier subunit [Selaginella moellendorffii]|eukprot:XP_002968526.2 molybdopterin synthase sulfur carrier subunit [Selaginella moellendorffii]
MLSMESQGKENDNVVVEVLFFARAREIVGVSQMKLELRASSTTRDCMEELLSRFPGLEEIKSVLIVALNHEYVCEPSQLKHGDEVALIPPVSGG